MIITSPPKPSPTDLDPQFTIRKVINPDNSVSFFLQSSLDQTLPVWIQLLSPEQLDKLIFNDS